MSTATDKPGVELRLHDGMASAEYHAIDACSASRLKAMDPPARCRWEMDNPKDTPALKFGATFHTFILEPEVWRARYVVAPDFGDCRFKENKARRDEWRIDNQDKEPVDADDAKVITGMARALCLHPGGKRLLDLPGRNELSGFWVDEKTGLLCKLRADRLVDMPGFGTVCVDLKTTDDASPDGFSSAIHRYGYGLQGAFYLHGLAQLGITCEAFVILAVEKDPPHLVGAYLIDDETIAIGEEEARRRLSLYRDCKRSGVWPGYGDTIQPIGLPGWVVRKLDREAAL